MSYRNRAPIILLLILFVLSTWTMACERHRKVPPLTEDEIEDLVRGQPQIFIEKQGTLTMEGVENLYLGQEYEEAMAVLEDYCGKRIKVFDGGWRHSDARFKGCIIEDEDSEGTKILRAGFWPFNDDRVSTLEIKSRSIPQSVVRARFTEISDELTADLPRRGLLMMSTNRYRLLANWDDGADQAAHITIGYHPP